MKKYWISAWDISQPDDEPQRLDWEPIIEANSLGDALSAGQQLFQEAFPDLDHADYNVHATGWQDSRTMAS